MEDILTRTEALIGKDAVAALGQATVAVFGLGGVGGYAAEALARSGVGTLVLIDNDTFSVSNINRQIGALCSTVGRYKTEVTKERIADINPAIRVETHNLFFLPETADSLSFSEFDYVIDAIDTVSGKVALAVSASKAGVPMISCMGTGNKLEPTMLTVADIYETEVCPLARVMRRELRAKGIEHLKVVYSKEVPVKQESRTPASCAFVPSAAGLIAAGEAIREIIKTTG